MGEDKVLEELTEKLRGWVAQNLGGERTAPIFASDGAWTCAIRESGKR